MAVTKAQGGQLGVVLPSLAMRLVFATLGGSWRYEFVGGPATLDPLRTGAMLVPFWHYQLPACGIGIKRFLLDGARQACTLSSHSRDGAIGTRTLEAWGVHVVRGSSSKGGRAALRGLHRALSAGHLVALTPDGPRGPARQTKAGIVALAQMTQAAVVPLGAWSSRLWTLRSWDRMQIPKPFARIRIVVGEPMRVLPGDDLEVAARRLDGALDRAIEQASP